MPRAPRKDHPSPASPDSSPNPTSVTRTNFRSPAGRKLIAAERLQDRRRRDEAIRQTIAELKAQVDPVEAFRPIARYMLGNPFVAPEVSATAAALFARRLKISRRREEQIARMFAQEQPREGRKPLDLGQLRAILRAVIWVVFCANTEFHRREITKHVLAAKTKKPIYCPDDPECKKDVARQRKLKERAVAYNTLTRTDIAGPPLEESVSKRKTSEARTPDGQRGEGEMDFSGGPTSRWDEIASAWQDGRSYYRDRPARDLDSEHAGFVHLFHKAELSADRAKPLQPDQLAALPPDRRCLLVFPHVDRLMAEAERGLSVRWAHRSASTPVGQLSPPRDDEDRTSPGERVLEEKRLRSGTCTGRKPNEMDPYLLELGPEFIYALTTGIPAGPRSGIYGDWRDWLPEKTPTQLRFEGANLTVQVAVSGREPHHAEEKAEKARQWVLRQTEPDPYNLPKFRPHDPDDMPDPVWAIDGPRGFWHEISKREPVLIRAERRGVKLPGQLEFEAWLERDREPILSPDWNEMKERLIADHRKRARAPYMVKPYRGSPERVTAVRRLKRMGKQSAPDFRFFNRTVRSIREATIARAWEEADARRVTGLDRDRREPEVRAA